ncbi:uncharacterized protein PITG_11709 [Phytophthora infestans T30-4]|uniref:Uncharacterized protein n=1 Tax=Phytophthora infestans (strain T30-4) TaxID=403677 RepID=D0NID6_PHYIT|nr:uncharacterized protein PITG_11709 [Phytophthora infestans T30-4]EEY59221.1 hypothetical protein PITG_11709 [Phytophthora infestans T30-4]|eukprot:XP_002901235.1 hypothetical protein PITG_11709 [Phytophthora infestans T30-4]
MQAMTCMFWPPPANTFFTARRPRRLRPRVRVDHKLKFLSKICPAFLLACHSVHVLRFLVHLLQRETCCVNVVLHSLRSHDDAVLVLKSVCKLTQHKHLSPCLPACRLADEQIPPLHALVSSA